VLAGALAAVQNWTTF